MGNRGILHNERGRIVRQWASSTWITCVLEFRGRASPGMFRPGHYSKLFFLDEATALAAGHRPCGECQRARYVAFREAWKTGNVAATELKHFSVKSLDRHLHCERTSQTATNHKVTLEAPAATLPAGVLVEYAGSAWLLTSDIKLRRWSFEGYTDSVDAPSEDLTVLTPASIVRAFRYGFTPQVHPSAI